jgi:ubiquinone/menaquinone biosynthesis C-methylase UbiE
VISPFDSAADGYDATFEDHPVTRDLREVVRQTLADNFRSGARVLELNCGTGTDAVSLAERGVRVTAIDSSREMIARARAKIDRHRLGEMVTCRELDVDMLWTIDDEQFDGAFSNFGGLNCTPRLAEVAESVSRILKPGAALIVCLLNRTCLWEMAAFIARGNPVRALRRFRRGGTDAPVGTAVQRVWYYSPGETARLLSPWFEVEETYGLSILSPAPNSRRFTSSHPGMTDSLLRLDGRLRRVYPFRSLGDHFVVVARRVSG